VELDGVQEVEQDVDSGQEVNGRRRRVRDEYAMGGIRLHRQQPQTTRQDISEIFI
jgi:hypothetical protein